MTPRFHPLRLSDVRRETADAVSLAFEVPEDLRAAYRHRAGQFLTLRARVGDEEMRRSYSICTAPGDGEIRVAVKRLEGGRFSGFVNEALAAGQTLDVMTPDGRFLLPEAAEASRPRTYAAVVAGSGITPVMAMIRDVLQREPRSRFFLFYGNRTSAGILFKDALDDLKDRYLDRLSVYHVLSREEQDLAILSGRLDGAKIEALFTRVLPARDVDHVFLCGPGGLVETARKVLGGLGVAPERIHSELFTPADGHVAHSPAPARHPAAVDHEAVASVILDGVRTDVPVSAGETIVEAAGRAGLEVPYSCKGGMCCTCRAKVVAGEVEMAVNYSLEPWELEAGFVLTCQSRPVGAAVTVDFDAA